jgi:aerobic carbon-monoxide dehydrogenase small subunit
VSEHEINATVNGTARTATVEPRQTLADVLRDTWRLTGTHVGCEHGVCGACTVLVDGRAMRSCLMFAVQADGSEITTVEGIGPAGGMGIVQEMFQQEHGLQCGFCTPGFVVSVSALLADNPAPTDEEIRAGLSGNLCRCTGYQGIIKAVRAAAAEMAQQ